MITPVCTKTLSTVTCHDNGLVKLWDYSKNTLLHTFNLEKEDLKKEKIPRLLVSPLNQPKSIEKPKLGVIHSVRFFDTDTQKYNFLSAVSIQNIQILKISYKYLFFFFFCLE